MTVRLAAVEDVLGSPVDQLTAADLRRAVEDHVSELPDLPFKLGGSTNGSAPVALELMPR